MQQSIRNPRTGRHDYTLVCDQVFQINEKSKVARASQEEWLGIGLDGRIEVLKEWAAHLERSQDDIVAALSIDTGRMKIAQGEVAAAIGLINGWAHRAPGLLTTSEPRPSTIDAKVMMHKQLVPFDLVGVISPWNFPLLLSMLDSVPALVAGSAVLLKPSEVTPRFIDPLEKTIAQIPMLASVFKMVRGGADQGQALIKNVDAVCFTGSVETGMKVAQASVEKFIPSFLELGGKDAAIILEDADLDKTVHAVLRSCVGATGQACQSLERIYVHETIHDEFVEKLIEQTERVTLNLDKIDEGVIGPIIFERQAEKLDDQIKDATREGAKIEYGGEIIDRGGLWCMPTVITNVHQGMKVMTEETFGPIIPIMAFKDEEEAVALANDSKYGLSGSVFSRNEKRALGVAMRMNAGGISINDASLTTRIFDGEKNSFNFSGMNASRMGDMGLLRFFRKKVLMMQTGEVEELIIS